MTGWKTIVEFSWDRGDILRACDGNKAACEVLEYFLYVFRLRAKDHKIDDLQDEAYSFKKYTIARLKPKTHYSERAVRRGISVLKAKGLVIATQPGGFNRTAVYQLNLAKLDAWVNDKLPLFPPNCPTHQNEELPCGQVGHIDAAKMATCMRPSWPHRSGQDGRFNIVTNVTKKVTEAAEEASAANSPETIKTIMERTSLQREHAEVILQVRPDAPADLVNAALDCWLDPDGAEKRWKEGNAVRFIRGVILKPDRFGVVKVAGLYRYQKTAEDRGSPKDKAIVERAKRKIQEMRSEGYEDRVIANQLHPIPSALIHEAFQSLGKTVDKMATVI